MKLYLAQHGEALSKAEDAGRPLSERGRSDVEAIAALAGAAGLRVARVWHSGKLRAEQTAQILATVVLPRGKAASIGGINPNDAVEDFVVDADVWQDDTLVVGHLPFMSRLVALLLVGDPERELVRYSPGSIVCLEHSGAHGWVLLWMLRPDAVTASGDRQNNP
ncbi:MAG: phosphohistidine phosphatase SixA [Gammaproteobacteria bacterium]